MNGLFFNLSYYLDCLVLNPEITISVLRCVACDYVFKEISVMELCLLHFHVGLGYCFSHI